MSRFIVECTDPTDIILGMKAIKSLINYDPNWQSMGVEFEDGSRWFVVKTKTGYSARKLETTDD